ncbi:FecR family protein [Pedobacter metabolipauper]|uniref:FecR family protein n=1 Tax=Pedobacter metabolipauper TaxID=425513 RepID=A0A4R6SZ69_9SPHI|nr:FecR family protein [Pedobacter metabolipauper]TDQ11069.1 FecR family protein [Pedobacter metabolipauper]
MQVNKELIQRYHLGECSPDEQRLVEAWLDSDEAEMSFPEETDLTALKHKGWKKISARYGLSAEKTESLKLKKSYHLKIWQYAAAVAVLVFAAFLFSNQPLKNSRVAYNHTTAKKGQKLQVTLSDGTIVWLNSESTMSYPAQFYGRNRSVKFVGEAYFSVAKDSKHPFIITTSKTQIQVLGTKFNVRAYPSEAANAVVVEEGKVSFAANHSNRKIILTANQQGIYVLNRNGNIMLDKTDAYVGKHLAWKNNELILDNQSVAEISTTLERWYNVKIGIHSEKLLRERYTGSFSNPSLKQVLESISFALKCSYTQHGNVFTLY